MNIDRLDQLGMCFIEAHESGDLETMAQLWGMAAADSALNNRLMHLESGLMLELDGAIGAEPIRLTAADIAEKLRLSETRYNVEERAVVDRLAQCEEALPETLTMRVVRGLWEQLGLSGAEKVARDFLEQASALMLRLGADQQGALMAARAVRRARKD
ncbi:MAG: hypothetical protein EBS30_02130 [Planctomycetes bacterium]|nr:hypothetical protein [Planctomycetota bacterium]